MILYILQQGHFLIFKIFMINSHLTVIEGAVVTSFASDYNHH